MAGLVDYSSSEQEPTSPPSKKRRLSSPADEGVEMPPLPAAFLDQYSSTVRTSTQDDPALHGGRKRVTPHVQGNWPAHVYLEWHPNPTEAKALSDVLSVAQNPKATTRTAEAKAHANPRDGDAKVYSLLENDLGVPLPLHVSLSRPLAFKTEQKDSFLTRLKKVIAESDIKAFVVQPKELAWHSNEHGTRWFLVMRLQPSVEQEMARLLETCNDLANEFGQPLLYADTDKQGKPCATPDMFEKFHISVAWSLKPPSVKEDDTDSPITVGGEVTGLPDELVGRLANMKIEVREVKVRIGQDVHAVPLKAARRKT